MCFKTGKVPNLWKNALIHPIPKDTKLDLRIPTNYRGICLLSVVAKCYSCFLNNRIQSLLEENCIIVEEQNGFRKDRSCLDQERNAP